jgi:hypothetical protein
MRGLFCYDVSMSKKKRQKQHKHTQAARPTIVHVSAVKRAPVHQWWVDHQRLARPVLIALAIAVVIIITLIGILGLISK